MASVLYPIAQGAQIWVKYINDKGGVNGHPVKMLIYDDGGDPARHQAQVKEAVERRHAIAFLANGEVLTGEGSVDYINTKRIPVIGGDGGQEWGYSSPMYFPQMSSGLSMYRGFLPSYGPRTIPQGKNKLGTAVCAEARGCASADVLMAEQAKSAGYEHVYRAKVSIAQPDFTAECLAARNAGVQVLVLAADVNTARRFSDACARQGYKPVFALIVQMVTSESATFPNLAGALASINVFPYSQTGTPASDEFQRAIATYGRGLDPPPGLGTAQGWVAGRLLEKAAAHLPESPTSDAILAGLWRIKNDDLGGLTHPLTFTENQPPPEISCWWNMEVKSGRWVSSDGNQRHCL